MKNKNLALLGATLSITTLACPPLHAKKIYPAEIMGRELLVTGLGMLVSLQPI
ncbi:MULTISPECIES: hypothetical protein [Legionella]|uniref:hypothetical protein n=1 Tax=Legionella TaxID=445 RepID=UPI001A93FEA2|nr:MULTISPECIES: hypothetical protein [Legionella]